jgi:hypothetical protein
MFLSWRDRVDLVPRMSGFNALNSLDIRFRGPIAVERRRIEEVDADLERATDRMHLVGRITFRHQPTDGPATECEQ